jgi:hypothetical protein
MSVHLSPAILFSFRLHRPFLRLEMKQKQEGLYTVRQHYHSYQQTNTPCQCTPNKPPHQLNACSKCPRAECALDREQIERPRTTITSVPTTTRCIPESTPPQVPSRRKYFKFYEPEFQACRICAHDYWAWCETCGYRLCPGCVLRECERPLGVENNGELVYRVRHPAGKWAEEP